MNQRQQMNQRITREGKGREGEGKTQCQFHSTLRRMSILGRQSTWLHNMGFVGATGATVEFDGFAGANMMYIGRKFILKVRPWSLPGFVRTNVTHVSFESEKTWRD